MGISAKQIHRESMRDCECAEETKDDNGPVLVSKGSPEITHKITPPSDPKEREKWEKGVAARKAAGRSTIVGEDYN
jgi:hypothetical protein